MNAKSLKYVYLHATITPQQAEKLDDVKKETGLRTSESVRRALDLLFKDYINE